MFSKGLRPSAFMFLLQRHELMDMHVCVYGQNVCITYVCFASVVRGIVIIIKGVIK